MPSMHVIQIIPRSRRAGQVSFVAGELHALGVLVEGGGFFSEGVVEVVGGAVSGAPRDQARSAQVVQVEVARAGLRLGGQQQAVAVEVVRSQAPAAVVAQIFAQDLAAQIPERPARGVLADVVGPDPLVVGRVEVGPILRARGHVDHLVETVVLVSRAVPARQVSRRVVDGAGAVQAVRLRAGGRRPAVGAGDVRQVAERIEGVALLLLIAASRTVVERRRDQPAHRVVGESGGPDRLDVPRSVVGVGPRAPARPRPRGRQRGRPPHLERMEFSRFLMDSVCEP